MSVRIADKIRFEKYKAIKFNFNDFIIEVADYLSKQDFSTKLSIRGEDESEINAHPKLFGDNNIYCKYSERYPEISEISIPRLHLEEALKTLQDEGFHVYKHRDEYKVSLEKVSSFQLGIHTWYFVENI